MDKIQYKEKLRALETAHRKEVRALQVEYAKANNTVVKGDTVEDDRGIRIRVETITVTFFSSFSDVPCCMYTGKRITKSGQPYKNGQCDSTYQLRVKKITRGVQDEGDRHDETGC